MKKSRRNTREWPTDAQELMCYHLTLSSSTRGKHVDEYFKHYGWDLVQ